MTRRCLRATVRCSLRTQEPSCQRLGWAWARVHRTCLMCVATATTLPSAALTRGTCPSTRCSTRRLTHTSRATLSALCARAGRIACPTLALPHCAARTGVRTVQLPRLPTPTACSSFPTRQLHSRRRNRRPQKAMAAMRSKHCSARGSSTRQRAGGLTTSACGWSSPAFKRWVSRAAGEPMARGDSAPSQSARSPCSSGLCATIRRAKRYNWHCCRPSMVSGRTRT
mmetsp:Transcript_15810/g.36150  ORF Transcript_15810/g.36150 Transcript_15810/m.36150 type:complete len:226 (-) Transcript_15810:582-1259(-)